jgi:hypothetical protein
MNTTTAGGMKMDTAGTPIAIGTITITTTISTTRTEVFQPQSHPRQGRLSLQAPFFFCPKVFVARHFYQTGV